MCNGPSLETWLDLSDLAEDQSSGGDSCGSKEVSCVDLVLVLGIRLGLVDLGIGLFSRIGVLKRGIDIFLGLLSNWSSWWFVSECERRVQDPLPGVIGHARDP